MAAMRLRVIVFVPGRFAGSIAAPPAPRRMGRPARI
jgi:hypothetical protein